jgi:hypothetical protein
MVQTNYTIYAITIKGTNHCYVGQTNNFERRKMNHTYNCIYNTNRKIYNIINEHGGIQNCEFKPLIHLLTDDHHSVTEIERFYIKKLNADMNSIAVKQDVQIFQTDDKATRRRKQTALWKLTNREYYNNKQKLLMRKINEFKKEQKRLMNILLP